MNQNDLIREIDKLAGKIALNSSYGPISLANSIVGVQPMTGYVGKIFTMKHKVTPKPKYKFSRSKWYEADYDWMHYDEVVKWCVEQFGPHPTQQDAWSRWDHRYEGRIYFRDQKDYNWFVLRWGA